MSRGVTLVFAAVVALGQPAPPVSAIGQPTAVGTPPSPSSISPSVDLGHHAVNGTVRAAVIDPATSITYLGGDFTLVGQRTGSVAVVDPPGASNGALTAASPEVMGVVSAVFADDRPGDPGFFIVGYLTAINGQKAPSQPVHRMHLSGGAWVLDTSWVVSGSCHAGNVQFPVGMRWIETSKYLVAGGFASAIVGVRSTTGLTLINRSTGRLSNLGDSECLDSENLLPGIPPLPDLAGCSALVYCQASASRLGFEPSSGRLVVAYDYAIGNAAPRQWSELVAYDLTPATGGRSWRFALGADPGNAARGSGGIGQIATLPGAILLRGWFPLDAVPDDGSHDSSMLLLDAISGTLRQRWNHLGEQDRADGTVIAPATLCEQGIATFTPSARIADTMVTWVAPAPGVTQHLAACRFRLDAGVLASERIGAVELSDDPQRSLPSVPWTAPDGTAYLIGSNAALDLTHAALVDWNPDPAMNVGSAGPGVTVAGDRVVLGGAFTFVRGMEVPGLIALGDDLAPVAGFDPQLAQPAGKPAGMAGVTALALSKGRLIVGGALLTDAGESLVALDATSGARVWVAASPRPAIVDAIAVGTGGDFWVGGLSAAETPETALQHYAAPDDGLAVLDAPVIGCLTAPAPAGSSSPLCTWEGRLSRVSALLLDEADRLYVAGAFGSVSGSVRRGLARLEAVGAVAAWDPDLLGVLSWSAAGGLEELTPRSMALLGDNLVVGGKFTTVEPNPRGGWFGNSVSPLLVFSSSSGALVRPTDPEHLAWFTVWPMAAGYAMVPTDAGLAVALGTTGMAIFDATTFDLDESASPAYLAQVWQLIDTGNGIYTLAVAEEPPVATGTSGTTADSLAPLSITAAATTPEPLIIGGVISRWRYRVAGNVVRATVSADTTPPVTSSIRVIPRTSGVASAAAVPVRVSWVGADLHGSGVARYQVALSTNGGAYAMLGVATAVRRANVDVRPGRTYRFRVRAVDNAGNVGAWAYSAAFQARIADQTSPAVRFSSGWQRVGGAAFLGGSARKRGVSGASASFTFTGRAVSFVSTMAPLRGRARIYVDGRFVTTVDLRSTASRYRTIVFAKSWAASRTHTLRIVVNGTSGRPRVDVDGFVVLR